MNKDEVLLKIQDVMRRVFNNDTLVVTMNTTANDIEEWTSLTYMKLIQEEEKVFCLKFKLKEILVWKSVGDTVDFLFEKLNEKL